MPRSMKRPIKVNNHYMGVLCILTLAFASSAYAIDPTNPKEMLQISLEMDTPPPPVMAPGALAPFGNTCADGGDLGTLSALGGLLLGDTSNSTNDFGDDGGPTDGRDGPCSLHDYRSFGGSGGDVIAAFTVDTSGPWTFTISRIFDFPVAGRLGRPSLNILEGGVCPGTTSTACDGPSGGTMIQHILLTAGTQYYLIVDTWAPSGEEQFGVRYVGPCASDQECSDRDGDLFCNGVESCSADGICSSSGFPCLDSQRPICDEASRECQPCNAATTCGDDGDPCNGIERCDTDIGECVSDDPCPDGFCRNGTCQDAGACDQSGEACRIDEDCASFDNGEICRQSGTGSLTPCWDGAAALGSNQHCTGEEVCVPGGNADVFCERDPCFVFLTDTSGYFAVGEGFQTFLADDMRLARAPAGRDVVSYQIQLTCQDGVAGASVTGPFDVTMQLWRVANFEDNPFAGLPAAPIPGTTCIFKDVPCGVGGPIGTPGRTVTTILKCAPNGGEPTGAMLGHSFTGIDNWIAYTASSDSQGISILGGPPLSQGTILGATGFDFWVDGNGLPAGDGGLGWTFAFLGGPPFEAGFGNANICTAVVGPCCLGVGGCEMLTETDCAAQGGSFIGVNDTLNPNNTCHETGDADGVADLCDNCPNTDNPEQRDCNNDGEGDACEADENEQDHDLDGVCNGDDGCPDDPRKYEPGDGFHQAPGFCGCGCEEPDDDLDNVADCSACCSRPDNCFNADQCPNDPNKVAPGHCGCGVTDEGDEDGDGVPDCIDQCRGVDDAIFAPECAAKIPALTEWGLVILVLLLLTAAKVASFARRRATQQMKPR